MMGLNSQFYLFEGLGINSHVVPRGFPSVINPASMRGRIRVLPREISTVFRATGTGQRETAAELPWRSQQKAYVGAARTEGLNLER